MAEEIREGLDVSGLIDKIWAAGDGEPRIAGGPRTRELLRGITDQVLRKFDEIPMPEKEGKAVRTFLERLFEFFEGVVMDQLNLIDCSFRAFKGLSERIDYLQAQIEGKALKDEHPDLIN